MGLVGLLAAVPETIVDLRTLLEAVEEGWWYTAVLLSLVNDKLSHS